MYVILCIKFWSRNFKTELTSVAEQMENVEDVTLLGVLWSWHCSEDRVLCPVHQRYRECSGGGKLSLCCQTSHHGALSGAGLHLQMGGETVEPGTAHSIQMNSNLKVRTQFSDWDSRISRRFH